ncbi:MAG: hypothetical protein ACI4D6_04390 [Chordicoccus sp.]|jgi:hypothetical protein
MTALELLFFILSLSPSSFALRAGHDRALAERMYVVFHIVPFHSAEFNAHRKTAEDPRLFSLDITIQHPDSERSAFLVVGGQSGFAACPPIRKLLKPFGEQALRPDFISFLMGAGSL